MNHIHAVLKLFHLAKVIFINKIPESRFISVRFFKFYQKFNILTKYLYTLDFRKAALHKAAFINFKHSIYNRDGWKWVLCQLYIVYLQLNGCRVHSFIHTSSIRTKVINTCSSYRCTAQFTESNILFTWKIAPDIQP